MKITEKKLRTLIAESIKAVLNEYYGRELPHANKHISPQELEKGDWVYIAPYNFYDQIEDKYDDEADTWHYPYDSMGTYKYTDMRPIPITNEFLEKNGFNTVQSSIGVGYVSYRGFKSDIQQEKMLPIYKAFNSGKIKYVHELQHMLRRYGVNKEINRIM